MFFAELISIEDIFGFLFLAEVLFGFILVSWDAEGVDFKSIGFAIVQLEVSDKFVILKFFLFVFFRIDG